MKTNVKLVKVITLFMLTVFMVACSGEDGAMGPAGPKGEQGPQGAAGPQGETGTANVIHSDWVERNFLSPGAQSENLQGLKVFNTSEFNPDQDAIFVYGKRGTGSSAEYHQLPYYLISQDEWYGFGIYKVTGGLGLQIRVKTTDGGSNVFTFFTHFRYVVIPGGVAASKNGKSLNYSEMSYEELAKHFNIPN